MSTQRRLRDESGMSLIELMISMSVLVIIIVPITTAFLLGILESTSARERVADSSTAQAISSFLLGDIQSSQAVYVNNAEGCTSSASDTVLLQMSWADPRTADDVVVSYFERVDSDGQKQLFRVVCTNAVAADATQLAHNLKTSSGFDVTCSPVACTSSSTPDAVAVHVEAESIEPQDDSSYEPFEFDFEATRRTGI